MKKLIILLTTLVLVSCQSSKEISQLACIGLDQVEGTKNILLPNNVIKSIGVDDSIEYLINLQCIYKVKGE